MAAAEFHDIIYQKHHRVQGAAWVTINRPEVMNSFTGQTLAEIKDAVIDANCDESVGVIVITGAGERAFCAGGDIKWLSQAQQEGSWGHGDFDPHGGIEECLKPIIARVNGYCIGGGNHLAYFCDFTIASENATFAQVGPRVGSPASGHYVSYLIWVVGAKKAKEMWMLCRRYTAQQALAMGLVNTVVSPDKLDEEVDKWCRELLALSPTCLKILKASFVEEFSYLFGQGDQLRRYLTTPEFWKEEQQEGARAFLEKRAPDFSRFRRRRGSSGAAGT
jgi:2-ketocyclohexanecarboxyl-CoA hydrolase